MRYINIGKMKVACWDYAEAQRFPNRILGRNGRIHTSPLLMEDKKLRQYVNEHTMGALDNYANHENLDVYITPLENDLFDDVKVSVFEQKFASNKEHLFTLKIEEGKEGFCNFLRSLYTNVADAVKNFKAPEK